MLLPDSDDVEQMDPAEESSKPHYVPEEHLIAVTTDYDEKYIERKPKCRRTEPVELLDSGYKFKKRFSLSDMYIKSYEKKGVPIPHFIRPKAFNSNSLKDYIYGNGYTNKIPSLSEKKSTNNYSQKDHGKKRKIKILFDDDENNMLSTNAYDTIYSINSMEWEPVAYEELDLLPAYTYSTENSDISKLNSVYWESLNYEDVGDFSHVGAKNYTNMRNYNRNDNINTSAEESLNIRSNEIMDTTDLVTKITSRNFEEVGKTVQSGQEVDDDKIEVFKQDCIPKNVTGKRNASTKSTVENDLNDYTDLESIIWPTLNTTNINNSNEKNKIGKPRGTDIEADSNFDIVELLHRPSNRDQESYRSELTTDLQNPNIEQTKEILQSNKLDATDFKPNLFPSTTVDDTSKEFRPFRTTWDKRKHFHLLLKNDSSISEKSDIFFNELLAGLNQRVVTDKYTTKNIPTSIIHGSRSTEVTKTIKKYSPEVNEKLFGQHINRINSTKASNEVKSTEETHSMSADNEYHVSRLVYKYKQRLSSARTESIERNTESILDQTLPIIDYDYLLYSQRSENTPVPNKLKKATRDAFSIFNGNPDHDERFEWNDYKNYDDVVSTDISNSKWQKVLPLEFPENKSSNNFVSLFTPLLSPGNHYKLYTKPPRTTRANFSTTQKFANKNVTNKRILHLKIHRNNRFPNLKSVIKKGNLNEGGDDIFEFNNWTDDHGTDYYGVLDNPITETGDPVTEPSVVNLRHLIDPYINQTQIHKRNVKSPLFDERFKTQNIIRLVTIIWHKNPSNNFFRNILQRTKHGQRRQKRECILADTPFVNAQAYIVETGKQFQSNCLKNIVSVDDNNITSNEREVMAATATSFIEKSNTKTTEYPLTKRENHLTTLEKHSTRFRTIKLLLPKELLLEENQPLSKHAKYRKRSQVKLGNIWRLMAQSNLTHSAPKSDDDNLSYTSKQTKVLFAQTKATEDNTVNIAKYERTGTIDPAISFTKKIIVQRESNDDDTETKLYEQKTGGFSQIVTPVSSALLDFTQKPINMFFKKVTAAVTPYKCVKELTTTENLTEVTPLLKHWTPYMFMNQELYLKPPIEAELTLPIDDIYTNDYVTKRHEPITQNNALKKLLTTTTQPETISLIPAGLFDPPTKNYLYFKRIGTTNTNNNDIKQKEKLSSAKRKHVLTKSLFTVPSPCSFVPDWIKTKTNMNKNVMEKHYLSFFSNLSKKYNNKKNIATAAQRKPIFSDTNDGLLRLDENSNMTTTEATKKIAFNFVKLHVPSNFTNIYVPSTISITTDFSKFNLLNTNNSTIKIHNAVEKSSTELTTETNKELTAALYSSSTENPITQICESSDVFVNTKFTLAHKLKQDKPNHWLYRTLNKSPIIVPHIDNINVLPFTKGVNKGSKTYKHWKSNHPLWVLHFWNKLHEDHQTLSLFPAKLKYSKLESTTEDTVVNLYIKNNLNKNTFKVRPTKPTAKVPTLPEIKRIRVVPLVTADNKALINTEFKPSS